MNSPEEKTTSTLICPSCGMEQKAWDDEQGVVKNGVIYCCDGCAENTGCTCINE